MAQPSLTHDMPGHMGFSVKCSPWRRSIVGVATATNFGLMGSGGMKILELSDDWQHVRELKTYSAKHPQHDMVFSEKDENIVLSASHDGVLSMFDINSPQNKPIQMWTEHGREIFSIHWNLCSKANFVSASMDGTIKIWSPEREVSTSTIPTFSPNFCAQWNPSQDGVICSGSADSMIRIFDMRTPASANNHLVLTIAALGEEDNHHNECIWLDWNKYNTNILAVANVDKTVRTFDLRAPNHAVDILAGHDMAVRHVAWSPSHHDVLASASYDMTVRTWQVRDSNVNGLQSPRQMGQMDAHTEFGTSVDWCMFGQEGWAASTAWDGRVCFFDARALPMV